MTGPSLIQRSGNRPIVADRIIEIRVRNGGRLAAVNYDPARKQSLSVAKQRQFTSRLSRTVATIRRGKVRLAALKGSEAELGVDRFGRPILRQQKEKPGWQALKPA